MADLQNITPVYYDSETKTHKPMGEGQVVDPKLIALSADDANILETHDDGLYVPAPAAPEPVTAQDLLSADKPNYLRLGNDGKLKVDGNDVLSNGGSNLLTINPVDDKIQLDEDTLRSSLHIVSGDKGNVVVEGSDKGAYLSLDDLLADSGILYKDQQGKLNAGLSLGYDNLTGKLSLYGNEGDNELSSVIVVAQGSMLIGAEFTHGMPSKEGEDGRTGDYHVSLSASYNGAYDGGVGLVFANIHKGQKSEPLSFTYQLFDSSHDDVWPTTWEAFFDGEVQSSTVGNAQGTFTATFKDGSKLEITSFDQTDLSITGQATFTPGIGIKGGYYLHLIFRLASGVITDIYLDFTDIVSFSAGCGITITTAEDGKRTISVVFPEDGGFECKDGKLALKLPEGGGLKTGTDGLTIDEDWLKKHAITKDTITAGNGIEVTVDEAGGSAKVSAKVQDDGGLESTAEGLAVKKKADGGLESTSDGLAVKKKQDGGLTSDDSGLGIDEDWLKKHAITQDTIKAGDGITVTVSGEAGEATIAAKAKENGGITVDTDGISVQTKTDGGITVDNNGLSIHVKEGDSLAVGSDGLYVTVAVTAEPAPKDTDVITYGWLTENFPKFFKTLIVENSALTVSDAGKIDVTVVSKDTDNLLGHGSDHGAYMNGDLNEGPDSDTVRNASKG